MKVPKFVGNNPGQWMLVEEESGQFPIPGLEQQYPNRPAHCTRKRVKPFMDACDCDWCEKINNDWEFGTTTMIGG